MSTSDAAKNILDKFPHFQKEEQELIKNLLVELDRNSNSFLESKARFLEIVYNDLEAYHRWDADPANRFRIRQRLLNVAGLFVVVPIEELRDLTRRVRLASKKIVNEAPVNPLMRDAVEIHSYDIKYLEPFARFFARIPIEPGISTLDYLAGNREKRVYPHSQTIVFRKNLREEVLSENYLTASAEPLTQSVLISLYNPTETLRDLITIGYDLVFESAFIDFYHHGENISPLILLRNAALMGKQFIVSALEEYLNLKKARRPFLDEFPVFLAPPEGSLNEKTDTLFLHTAEKLLPQVSERIRNWNAKLGLSADNEDICWPPPPEKKP